MDSEIKKVIVGSVAPIEWLLKGYNPVDPGVALSRAGTCVTCPKNGVGPLSQWFTKTTAAKIKKAIEARTRLKMSTLYDAALGMCEACACPLPLKVHEPIDLIQKHLKPKTKSELWPKCWILRELQESETTHDT